MTTSVIFWLVAFLAFVVTEAVTAGLTSVWFALGALVAMCCAWLRAPLWLQLFWFVGVSAATLVLTRPLVKKYVNGKQEATNADRYLKEQGIVTETINNPASTGTVNMNGRLWTARSADGAVIPVGRVVTAVEIRGVKLIVREVALNAGLDGSGGEDAE